MSSQDSHSAHTTPEYRNGWDRIFAGKKHVDCARHKSAEPDMRERCTCCTCADPSSGVKSVDPSTDEPARAEILTQKRWTVAPVLDGEPSTDRQSKP